MLVHDPRKAIEAVADKRHARMCAVMPEEQAAKLIVNYLNHMLVFWKGNRSICHFIVELRKGYEAALCHTLTNN